MRIYISIFFYHGIQLWINQTKLDGPIRLATNSFPCPLKVQHTVYNATKSSYIFNFHANKQAPIEILKFSKGKCDFWVGWIWNSFDRIGYFRIPEIALDIAIINFQYWEFQSPEGILVKRKLFIGARASSPIYIYG